MARGRQRPVPTRAERSRTSSSFPPFLVAFAFALSPRLFFRSSILPPTAERAQSPSLAERGEKCDRDAPLRPLLPAPPNPIPNPPAPTSLPPQPPPPQLPPRPARRLLVLPAPVPPPPRRPEPDAATVLPAATATASAAADAAAAAAAARRECRRTGPGGPGGGDLRLHVPLRQARGVPHSRGARRGGPRRPRGRRRVQRGVALPRMVPHGSGGRRAALVGRGAP